MIVKLVFHCLSLTVIGLYLVIFYLSWSEKRIQKATRIPGKASSGMVRVVVPTYNEADNIGRCLDSILSMRATTPFDVTVVDDNSPDGTADVVSRYDAVNLIRREARSSKADALNFSVETLEGEIFAVTDADCVVSQSWLDGLVEALQNERVGVATGPVLVRNRGQSLLTRFQACELAFLCYQLLRPVKRVGMLYSINGNNFAFRRGCWLDAGRFDPTKLTEDTDFAIRVRNKGYEIAVADANVFTTVPSSIRSLLRQRRRWYIGWYQDLSSPGLLAGALFILFFYYASVFFLAAASLLSVAYLCIYYGELLATCRMAYRETRLVDPVLFMLLSPVITTLTLLAALPSVIRGGSEISFEKHW